VTLSSLYISSDKLLRMSHTKIAKNQFIFHDVVQKNKRVQFFKHNVYSPGATSHGSLGEIGIRSIKQILLAVQYKIFYTYLPIRL